MKYDYIIVGAGLYGSVFAQIKAQKGCKCLVIDRRRHIAGNIYSKNMDGIEVHIYGPHIFHTDSKKVWDYVNQFTEFNHFRYSPIANYKGELYNLPFNMNTFSQMWGVRTPAEAETVIKSQVEKEGVSAPENLEEQALSFVGRDIYEKLIKGYTQKQWGRPCKELPASIIKRIPIRFVFDNNYFNHPYQGIPKDGYTAMVRNMLKGIDVRLNTDYLKMKENLDEGSQGSPKIVYTGAIDEFFGYKYGELEYRGLRFQTQRLGMRNYQGVAGMNYTDAKTPYTRIIEHKHFVFDDESENTIITMEFPTKWRRGEEPYYPICDLKNSELYSKYLNEAAKQKDRLLFGGRLGLYQYLDMDQVILRAMNDAQSF